MPVLRRIPVLRFLVPLIAGILFVDYIPDGCMHWTFQLWPYLIVFWLILLSVYKTAFSKRHYFGVLVHFYFGLAGMGLSSLSQERFRPFHYLSCRNIDAVKASVISSLQERKKSFKMLVELEAVKNNGAWEKCSGKMMVYLKKEPRIPEIDYGDIVIFKRRPELIRADSLNLYVSLSLHRQIFSRVFLDRYAVIKKEQQCFSLPAAAIQCRQRIVNLLLNQFHRAKEAAIAIALVVGEEVSIDDELTAAYSATGTLHVLSVSGMHVGLIFLLLGFIFKPLVAHRHGRHFYYPLVMISIWSYAFIAGAAPSIVRASAMCTFFLISKWVDRKNLGIGSLGASLFFLLLVNPFTLYEPGLQLSLFAVWGIIWLQPILLRAWVPQNWLLFKLWEMTCISLAAQVMTLPVSLYYFGTFPNYFLVANLFVIPLTTACIYGCILQLLLTPLPGIQTVVIWINNGLLKASNYLVLVMKDWPGAVSHWEVKFEDMLLMYCLYLITHQWIRTGNFKLVLLTLVLLLTKTIISLIQLI